MMMVCLLNHYPYENLTINSRNERQSQRLKTKSAIVS
jgi:hypothetical protein